MIYNGVQAHEVEYRNLEGQHDGTVYAQKKADPMLETRFEVAKVKGVVEATDLIALDGSTTVTGKSRLNITEYRGSTSNSDGKAWGKGTYPIDIDDDLLGQTVVIYIKGLDYLSPNAAGMMVHWKPYFAHCPQMRIWKT